jgi:hypothetical protein
VFSDRAKLIGAMASSAWRNRSCQACRCSDVRRRGSRSGRALAVPSEIAVKIHRGNAVGKMGRELWPVWREWLKLSRSFASSDSTNISPCMNLSVRSSQDQIGPAGPLIIVGSLGRPSSVTRCVPNQRGF